MQERQQQEQDAIVDGLEQLQLDEQRAAMVESEVESEAAARARQAGDGGRARDGDGDGPGTPARESGYTLEVVDSDESDEVHSSFLFTS